MIVDAVKDKQKELDKIVGCNYLQHVLISGGLDGDRGDRVSSFQGDWIGIEGTGYLHFRGIGLE